MSTKNHTSVGERIGRVVDPDAVLTPDQAKRLRRSLKQTREGKTRPWPRIKHKLDL